MMAVQQRRDLEKSYAIICANFMRYAPNLVRMLHLPSNHVAMHVTASLRPANDTPRSNANSDEERMCVFRLKLMASTVDAEVFHIEKMVKRPTLKCTPHTHTHTDSWSDGAHTNTHEGQKVNDHASIYILSSIHSSYVYIPILITLISCFPISSR